MIVRDEARCLGRCLESVSGLVDEVNILDTGSVDGTLDIARRYTERVSQQPWTGDFAAARNRSIEMASEDRIVIMDADEWLDASCRETFRHQVERIGSPDVCGDVLILSPFEAAASPAAERRVSRSWIPRVFARPVRYVGAIHEQPAGPLSPTRLDITFHHDGYLQTQVQRKAGRNAAIIRRTLEASGRDAYLQFQLGRELLACGDVEAALVQFSEACQACPADAPYRLSVVLALSQAFNQTARYEEALRLLESETANSGDSADLFFAVGTTLINWAPERVEDAMSVMMPIAVDSFLRCLDLGRRLPGMTEVEGVDSYHAARNLAIIYREAYGDAENAARYERLERELREASGAG